MEPTGPVIRTCKAHGVVLAPDGHCVICRRALSDDAEDPAGSKRALTALAVLAAAVGSVLLYKGLTSREEPPIVKPAAVVTAPAIVEPQPAPEQDRAQARTRRMEERIRAVEAAKKKVAVTIYTTKWCDLCKTATAWMKEKQIAFEEHDVEEDAERLKAMQAKNPENTVPTIVLDDEVIVGFGPGAVLGALYRAADKRVRF